MADVTQADRDLLISLRGFDPDSDLARQINMGFAYTAEAQEIAAHRQAAHEAGVKAGLEAAGKAIIEIEYDGKIVPDNFAEGTSAAYEVIIALDPATIGENPHG